MIQEWKGKDSCRSGADVLKIYISPTKTIYKKFSLVYIKTARLAESREGLHSDWIFRMYVHATKENLSGSKLTNIFNFDVFQSYIFSDCKDYWVAGVAM